MCVTRRSFVRGGVSVFLGATVLKGNNSVDVNNLRDGLEALLMSAGCDPASENGALLAIMSDPHIFLGTDHPHLRTEKWDDDLINELNSLSLPITNLAIAGDLISYRSMTPGSPAYGVHELWAIEEYAAAQIEVQRFNMPIWMIPGNHDTYAYETDAEMFKDKMGVPAYQRVELGGVPIFLLNTGNAGMLNTAQEEWLRAEAKTIDKDQDVLIIQHIPTFTTVYTQAGSKRIIAEAFSGRSAPVYIASGHNHRFSESVSEYGGTKFVQMATTTANRLVFSDRKDPGYLLIGIQDGEICIRIRRSLTVNSFWPRPDIATLPVKPVRFPFDEVTERMAYFEEGFYDGDGVIEYSGVHVGCYIAYCKWAIVKVKPADYYGEIRRCIISGYITASRAPKCWVSTSGAEGSWTEIPFPAAAGSGLYSVDLPLTFTSQPEFYIKYDTEQTGSVKGFSWSGWALASDADSLSGYEKWLLEVYGTLQKNPENEPSAIANGGEYSNLLTYAFNLPPRDGGSISGLPKVSIVNSDQGGDAVIIRYMRIKDHVSAGWEYRLETTNDMKVWSDVDLSTVTETVIDVAGEYEQATLEISTASSGKGFYRVDVQQTGLIQEE